MGSTLKAVEAIRAKLAKWEAETDTVGDAHGRGVIDGLRTALHLLLAADTLSFAELRAANIARLPVFKNRLGQPAHSEPDGSDWSPAQWLQAVTGELGEYANLRKKYERGDLTQDEFASEAWRELADVLIYLDILAFQLKIDLGEAVRCKFNEVSERVGCSVFIGEQKGGIQ